MVLSRKAPKLAAIKFTDLRCPTAKSGKVGGEFELFPDLSAKSKTDFLMKCAPLRAIIYEKKNQIKTTNLHLLDPILFWCDLGGHSILPTSSFSTPPQYFEPLRGDDDLST